MILVVGAKGMLGRDLIRVLPGDVRGVDIEEIDITSPESVRRVILTLKPRVVVNCAAYTDVDGCETNADLAMAVNGEGVGNLTAVTREIGALLVQMSTDYVFDGAKESPFLEDDPPNPLSVYGRSKLLGEEKARENPDHLIVRTQWLYGLAGKNFVETMLRLSKERSEIAVVDDQVGSPTWTMDLALAISELIENNCRGTYHAANRGICSWYEFARTIFAEAGTEMTVRPQTTAQLGRPAQRPLYSALCCDKLTRDTGLELEGWREALATYLETRREAGLS
ncbi:dTDP-4-dehydrorhamnose reductase [Geobacter sulfurreducens]|uniref:dTDP-4-dehydrorhamnose reductase n=1 Tax=Geobacter sulfurreducens TaxID=35554 RepID=UPI000DBB55E1|nr:dTDP-4-dehydrorhamnose reductase [Geobacter sulfurreducens]BBA70803.1 dTDP-4-dehydrorhamnose reductase [Geobacter sulfurreducens]